MLPALPTLAEAGVEGYDAAAWQAIYTPAGTPEPIRRILSDAAARAIADPGVVRRLADAGVDTMPDPSPQAAARHLEAEVAKWGELVRALGLRGG